MQLIKFMMRSWADEADTVSDDEDDDEDVDVADEDDVRGSK